VVVFLQVHLHQVLFRVQVAQAVFHRAVHRFPAVLARVHLVVLAQAVQVLSPVVLVVVLFPHQAHRVRYLRVVQVLRFQALAVPRLLLLVAVLLVLVLVVLVHRVLFLRVVVVLAVFLRVLVLALRPVIVAPVVQIYMQ